MILALPPRRPDTPGWDKKEKVVLGSRFKSGVFAAGVTIALGIGGCGGGGSSSNDPGTKTTSVSGRVVDGYISGATVCVDANSNGRCDSGEPVSAASGEDGAFTIKGVAISDAASAPLVAVIPATAVDSDTATAVGNSFVLMTPGGQTVVSPLTTLVQQAILKDSTLTADGAATQVNAYLPGLALTNAELLSDYVAGGNAVAHDAAKVVANSLKANYEVVKEYAAGNDKNLAIVLAEVAKQALQSQGSAPKPASPVGVEDVNTLRAAIASRTATAATQTVTISFDMVNAGTSVRCGDAITVADTQLWDLTATPPVKLATPVAQNTAGRMVDTRFYVSNVLLLDAAGNAVPLVMDDNGASQSSVGLALLDFGYNTAASGAPIACTTTYNTMITGKVAPGTYSGISMTIGVPIRSADFSTKLNHVDAANTSVPAPLQLTAVNWTWQSGRKFTKIEFLPDTPLNTWDATSGTLKANAGKAWNVHIGSTGCAGDPMVAGKETACTNANRLSLRFDSFDVATQKVVFDVAQLYKNADLAYDSGGPMGCMSGLGDGECAPIFKAVGIDLPTGKVLLNGDGTANQTTFSVVAK